MGESKIMTNPNHMLARRMAEGSIVLLKNENGLLPFRQGQRIALFGQAQAETVFSGSGSGAVFANGAVNILDACENILRPVDELAAFYRGLKTEAGTDGVDWTDMEEMSRLIHSGVIYEYFGRYRPTPEEPGVPEDLIRLAAGQTDAAVYVLGRCSGGEECDRHLKNDYYLSETEIELITRICSRFPKVVLVLNINGLVDLGWIERFPAIKSVLFLGVPGEAGAEALLDILVGKAVPSGKLAVTIPKKYGDFPSAEHFSWNKEDLSQIKTYADYGLSAEENGSHSFDKSPVTVYKEGIYNGYRYYETFRKEPLFPFGHGLSYTEFACSEPVIRKTKSGMEVHTVVTNTGVFEGREVVQIYVEASQNMDYPARTLQGFKKTGLLLPGASEEMRICVPWRGFARYDSLESAWVIPAGRYALCVGGDVSHAKRAAVIDVSERITVERCGPLFALHPANQGKISFLRYGESRERIKENGVTVIRLEKEDVCAHEEDGGVEKGDSGERRMEGLADFSVEELASLSVGYGPGTPFAAFGDPDAPSAVCDGAGRPLTVNDHKSGMPGYVSPAIPEKGIHSVSYADGPAGVGLTAWPSEMLLACSFDTGLCEQFGDAIGGECEKKGVDVWLAPAVNLHRNPLCGRAFEYFSEDPLLSGRLALGIVSGVQENHPVLVCPKHFAANEQETFRRGNTKLNIDAADSIIEERALRELYLRPFEILVREGKVHCMMTSFNKINGVFAAGNRDLCTSLLRKEWGFTGAVVTDWGDMDTVVDGAVAVAAGIDIVMPGGPPVIGQILKGYAKERLSRRQLENAVEHFRQMLYNLNHKDHP